MELKQELGLKPQISQETVLAVSVLQMGTQELKEYLQEVMLENPVMELEETYGTDSGVEAEKKLQWLEAGDYQNKFYYQQELEDSREPAAPETMDLREYLMEQLIYMNIEKKYVPILNYMIQSLDEHGYFTEDEEETSRFLQISLEEIKKAREMLCAMEPAGAGAANLQECLLIQLRRKENTELECEIVEHYLEEFSKNQLEKIAKKTKKSLPDVVAACERIKTLNPRPSNRFSSRLYKDYLTPDVIVVKLKDYFEILVNDYDMPKILVSTCYRKMLQQENNREAQEYVRDKIRQAEWLQNCVEQRNGTLLRLVESILHHQTEFFQKGKGFLVPMTQKETAEEMGVHPSTISRAVKGKYLQCTWGVYPLAFFFSMGMDKEEGKEKTAEAVKSCILKILETENKRKPYSDRMLAEKLQEMGIDISRRTVAKYRESMQIRDALGRKIYVE